MAPVAERDFVLGLLSFFSALFLVRAAADAGAPGAYLRQEVGGRAAALSGAYGAIADDGSAAFWNPSGLARVAKPEVSAAHLVLYEDTAMDLGLAAFPIRGWGGAAIGYLRQSTGGFERRASPLDAPVGFSITQTAFFAGWGRSFSGLPFPVRVGAAAKAVRETIDTAGASSWGADLGVGIDPLPRLSLGLMLQNLLAPKLTFRSEPQTYPRVVDASAAYTFGSRGRFNAVTVLRLANVGGFENKVSGGIELWQDRLAAIRLGSDGDGFATGFGFRIANLHIDYAAVLRDLGTAHQVSLRLQFGQTREELEELIRRGIQKLTKDEAKRLAKAYVKSAERSLEESNYPKAISDFEAAALWDPEDPLIARRLQEVLGQVEQTVRAQIVERTALLAEQQFKRGNWVASEAHWKSVLDMDPANARAREALTRISEFLAERAQKEAAEREAQRARVERSRKEALSFVLAGETSLKEGRFREAAEQATAAFKAMPGLKEAEELRIKVEEERVKAIQRRVEEGERLTENKLFDKALAAFDGVLAEDPRNARAQQGLVKLRGLLRAPLTQEQLKQIEKTYYLAVDAYLKGRYADAKRHLDEIFKIDAADENARKLKEKVDAALKLGTK